MALAAVAGAGRAESVVAKSSASDAYGWGETASVARAECSLTGRLDCAPVISCPGGGWTVLARPGAGLAALAVVCGQSDADARRAALALCMRAANDLCWTADVVDPQGKRLPAEPNAAFDRAFHAGGLLRLAGLDPAGLPGDESEAYAGAVRAFEARLQLGVSGTVTRQTLFFLLAAAGGRQAYVDAAGAQEPALQSYVWVAQPAARRTFSDELLAQSPEDREAALIALVLARGAPCLDWMGEVTPPVPPSGVWTLLCQDGRYTITLAPGDIRIDTEPLDPETDPLRME